MFPSNNKCPERGAERKRDMVITAHAMLKRPRVTIQCRIPIRDWYLDRPVPSNSADVSSSGWHLSGSGTVRVVGFLPIIRSKSFHGSHNVTLGSPVEGTISISSDTAAKKHLWRAGYPFQSESLLLELLEKCFWIGHDGDQIVNIAANILVALPIVFHPNIWIGLLRFEVHCLEGIILKGFNNSTLKF
jgi:hypothetical protein